MIIKTERLILRPWKESDFEPFALMNADPHVREFFPSLLTKNESNEMANQFKKLIETQGWGLWAAEVPGEAPFIGFVGIAQVPFEAHFTPAVEIGWRLAYEFWGKGYATEAAKVVMNFGFNQLKLEEIVSFTVVKNIRSRHVMEKLGMTHDPADNFDHPRISKDSPQLKHVLYRKTHSL